MKLVVLYSIGDGCTYHCTETLPIEYSSAEQFLIDFENNVLNHQSFSVGLRTFDWRDFFFEEKYYSPAVLTIDEWFAAYA